MKGVLVVLAVAACDEHGKSPPVRCAHIDCSIDELCLVQLGVPGLPHDCIPIPNGCPIGDCMGVDCPACLQDLCGPPGPAQIVFEDRTLTCPVE